MPTVGDEQAARNAARVNELAEIGEKLDLLLKTQRWDRAELDAWRLERLNTMLERARGIAFWRDRIEEDGTLSSVEPLDRDTLRASYAELVAPEAGPTIHRRTSGSSGAPVELEHGPAQIGFAAAARLRQLSWFGLAPEQHPTANMLASLPAAAPAIVSDDGEPVEFLINHWALDAETLAPMHARMLDAGGVRVIGGSTSMVERWAELVCAEGLDGSALGVELAVIGSEMSYDGQRRLIERAFACRAAEMYGSWEAQMIAGECPQGRLHVNEEVVWLEVLRGDGTAAEPGEFGDVVVTLLHNIEFPLIRYRLGDMARRLEDPCPCGRPQMALDIDIARREDMISCRDGRRFHPRLIRSTLERELGTRLHAFHTVQEAIGRFRCEIQSDGPTPADLPSLIEAELRHCMGEPVEVEVVASGRGRIERLRSGKLRTFTNLASPINAAHGGGR